MANVNDWIKPLKLEYSSPGEFDLNPTEVNPNDDGILAQGFALKNTDTTLEVDSSNNLVFKDLITGPKTLAELASITGTVNLNNIITVDPLIDIADEIEGSLYKTYADAVIYIEALSPSITDIYIIQLTGLITENIDIKPYIWIDGQNSAFINGILTSTTGGLTTNTVSHNIFNCTINNIQLTTGTFVVIRNSNLSGSTNTSGVIYLINCVVLAGDFLDCDALALVTSFGLGGIATIFPPYLMCFNSPMLQVELHGCNEISQTSIDSVYKEGTYSSISNSSFLNGFSLKVSTSPPTDSTTMTLHSCYCNSITINTNNTLNTLGCEIGTVTLSGGIWNNTGDILKTTNFGGILTSSEVDTQKAFDKIDDFPTQSIAISNKTIDVDNNTVSNIETDNFKANVIDIDDTLAANSDSRIASQQAVKAYITSSIATALATTPGIVPIGSIIAWHKTYTTKTTGTTTSTVSGKLMCNTKLFTNYGILANMIVYNSTDSTWSYVVSVDSDTQITIGNDIFTSGEVFSIYATPKLTPQFVECNGQGISDVDSPYDGQYTPNLNGDSTGVDSPGQSAKVQMFLKGGMTSGTGQLDMFQHHYHAGQFATGGTGGVGCSANSNSTGSLAMTFQNILGPTAGTGGTPRTGSETLPRNMTIVWIVRIK